MRRSLNPLGEVAVVSHRPGQSPHSQVWRLMDRGKVLGSIILADDGNGQRLQ
ncbi:MAG: hypothetical protein HOH74_04705 [Gemmatimonadetes bacterium]|nr:hypothetical protein [Gemmatimonadota bacterium]